jgi:hypothetical protein
MEMVPFKGIVCEKLAIATDSAGALQIEAQDVRFKGRGKPNVLALRQYIDGKRWSRMRTLPAVRGMPWLSSLSSYTLSLVMMVDPVDARRDWRV